MKIYLFFSYVPMDFEGPCYIQHEKAEFWFIKNRIVHRIDGPAISYNDENHGTKHLFFVNGESFTEKQFWQHPLVAENTFNEIVNGKIQGS